MVRTSRSKDEPTEEELELLSALHELTTHPAFAAARKAVEEMRERYFRNLAKSMATGRAPIDQRMLDEKRGFWMGALWAVYGLPKTRAKRFDEFIAEALKESEEQSGS